VDKYFLEERCPYSQKRKLKSKNLKIVFGTLLGAALLFVLIFGSQAEQAVEKSETVSVKSADVPTPGGLSGGSTDGGISVGGSFGAGSIGIGLGGGMSAAATSPRQYGASQIVRGGEGGNGFGLPMGSTITARLINTLLSSDSAQPVIAEVVEDAVWRNSVLIPTGARAVGTASFDDAAKRLQLRFTTFIYPDGSQHPVQAMALLENGSSGIPGDYHSGATQKEVGRFLGNFVGGLTDGMKERQVGGQGGMAFEPGSLKNGILNGITVSGLDQAKSFSEGMQNVRPYLEVAGGTAFLLYFEKEYSP
jgi:hypothetical protein